MRNALHYRIIISTTATEEMSFCRCCCSCIRGEGDEAGDEDEVDYLLPGGEWDPSVSGNARRPGSNRTRSNRSSRGSDHSEETVEDGSVCAYVPPDVPGASTAATFQDFKMLRTVGQGAFGKVMLCVHTSTNVLYAMKVVPKAKIRTQKQINQILSELKILKRIQHPFCVALKSSFQDDNFLFYVFYFAAGGMLFYHLKQEYKFSEGRARFYLGEIVLALHYLHGFNIIFRDLKPENCMLSEQGHIILTDFGSAKSLEYRERANTLAGTPHYMAPEVLRGEPYNFSADWWSSGILLYEMLTGKAPFNSADRADLYKMVLRCDFKVPSYVSPRARSLLYKLINRDPEFRLGCGGSDQTRAVMEIKEHTFFSPSPMDPDEEVRCRLFPSTVLSFLQTINSYNTADHIEMHYVTEEAERERHRQALERTRRSRQNHHLRNSGSFVGAASSVLRNISKTTTRRVTGSMTYQGTPCEWTWEDLESRNVTPPFKPRLRGPTDLHNFDPIITIVPATITELATSDKHLHIDGFDFTASGHYGTVASGTSGGGGEDICINDTPGGRSNGSGGEVDVCKEQTVMNDT